MMVESLQCASAAADYAIAASSAARGAGSFYLDPGTGSMMIQIVIGALAGGLISAKLILRRIGARLSHRVSENPHAEHIRN